MYILVCDGKIVHEHKGEIRGAQDKASHEAIANGMPVTIYKLVGTFEPKTIAEWSDSK